MGSIIEEVTKGGNYTAYGCPTVQIEGSFVWMHDDMQKMIDIGYYGAIEIFDTPGVKYVIRRRSKCKS